MKIPELPVLSFSHATRLLTDLHKAGLISDQGQVLTYKAEDPALLKKRMEEVEAVNWAARGFRSWRRWFKANRA